MAKKFINTGFAEFIEDAVQTRVSEMPWMKDRTFKYAESIKEVEEFVDNAIKALRCALDLETTGLSTRVKVVDGVTTPVNKIVGFGVCYDSKFGLYIPINHREGSEYNLPEDEVLQEIKRLCLNCITIYHNAKFDLTMLKHYGIELDDFTQFEDTLLLAYLQDSGRKQNNLKGLSDMMLNQPMLKFTEVAREGHFDLVSPNIGYVYGVSDAVCTLDLYNHLASLDIVKQQRLIYEVEKRVVFVLMDMEANLVKMDVPYFKELKKKVEDRIKEIEQEIYDLVGFEFNLGSAQKLGEILFDKLKYKYPEKSKTKSGQYSTNEKTLQKIADLYPIVKKIVEYRGLEKVLTTYINNLLRNYDEDDCVKFSFKQTGTDTGRFSSPGGDGIEKDGLCGVNVQSTPKMPPEENPYVDMRRGFIARDGFTMVAIDYANEEMRIATNLSNETKWMESIEKGIDFHTATGAIISGKDPKDVLKAERKIGKTVNFLALFLGGPYTLAGNAKITIAEARKILATFFSGVPNLKKWIDQTIVRARKEKFVKTTFGRTRPLGKYYKSGDKGLAAHADRCAVNTRVQGSAADIMKLVMSKLNSWLTQNNLHDDIKVLITMHDELVYEIRTEKLQLYVPEICKIMQLNDVIQDKIGWRVPLEVDVQYGENWRVENDFFKDFPELRSKLSEPLIEFVPKQERKIKRRNNPSEEDTIEKEELPKDPPKEEKEVIETQEIKEEPQSDTKSEEVNPEKTESGSDKVEERQDKESDKYFIYTLKRLTPSVNRFLNQILMFLMEEYNEGDESKKKILRLRDKNGNSLLVSEFKVMPEIFLAFTRYFGI